MKDGFLPRCGEVTTGLLAVGVLLRWESHLFCFHPFPYDRFRQDVCERLH